MLSVNRCKVEFPTREPSCHLSFSAKSQEPSEWSLCSCFLFRWLTSFSASSARASSTFSSSFHSVHSHSCSSKQINEWVTPGIRVEEEALLSLPSFLPLSLSPELGLRKVSDGLRTSPSCLINMLIGRRSVPACVWESLAVPGSGSGQVPRREHQYKDASERITQQSIWTITQ